MKPNKVMRKTIEPQNAANTVQTYNASGRGNVKGLKAPVFAKVRVKR